MMRRYPVVLFLLLTFVLSLPFYLLLNLSFANAEGRRLFVTGLMWGPGLAALLTCLLARIPLATLGWRWPGGRAAWLGYLIPIGYGLFAYGIIWATGMGKFSTEIYLPYARRVIGLPEVSDGAVMAMLLVLQLSMSFLLNVAMALGEEIGWRGFLGPRLVQRFGFGAGPLFTGLIWAVWHYPVLFWLNFPGDPPKPFAMVCFTIMVTGLSYVYAWLRERTGSVWTAAFLHGSHNAVISPVFTLLTVETGLITVYAVDEFGFMLAVTSVLMALWCWRHRVRQAVLPAAPASALS